MLQEMIIHIVEAWKITIYILKNFVEFIVLHECIKSTMHIKYFVNFQYSEPLNLWIKPLQLEMAMIFKSLDFVAWFYLSQSLRFQLMEEKPFPLPIFTIIEQTPLSNQPPSRKSNPLNSSLE